MVLPFAQRTGPLNAGRGLSIAADFAKDMDAPLPPVIPDLQLLRRIGVGSYGDVWLARTLTGVYRAVKVVDRARFADDRPFQRELEGISRFQRSVGDRPRQLALLHVGRLEEQGVLYYVMELADDVETGTDIDPERYEPLTCKALRARRPMLPAAECVRIGVELARGLAELHGAGLIHRDVKPSNIIFVGGVPKLADIGLVSSREASVTSLGTPGYSPPEGSGTLDADLWGLGRILYELCTGLNTRDFPRLPPDFDQREDARALLELNEVVLKACEPVPADRYPTAQAMLDDLLLIQAGRSVKDLARLRERLRALGRVAAVAAAMAVVVIAALGVKNYFTLRALAATEAAARRQAEEDERLAQYTANLHIAQLAFVNGDVGVARAALRREIPADEAVDLRGLEWYALWNETAGGEMRSWGEVGDPAIEAIALGPDEDVLAAMQDTPGRELIAWDLAAGSSRVLATGVWRLGGFTADGEQLVVGMNDGTLRLVPLATGQPGDIQLEDVRLLDHAQDGRTVLLGAPAAAPTRLRVWDFVEQVELGAWEPGADLAGARIRRAVVSPNGRLVAVHLEHPAAVTTEVVVWDISAEAYRFRQVSAAGYVNLGFTADSEQLVVAAWFQPVRVFDLDDGALSRELVAVPDYTSDLLASPDGRWLSCAGEDGSVRVFDVQSGELVADLRGHEAALERVAWSSDGSRLFSAGMDGTIREWEVPGSTRVVFRGGYWRGYFGNPVWVADGSSLIATLADGRLTRVDPTSLEPVGAPLDASLALGVSADRVWALNGDRALVSVDPVTGAVQPTALRLEGPSALYWAGAASDGSVVVLGQADGTLAFWDTAAQSVLLQDRRETSVRGIAVSPDGNWAVTGELSGRVWLWRPREGRLEREIPSNGLPVSSLAFSSDGLRFLVFTRNGEMAVWRVDTQEVELRRLAHAQGCQAAVFTADGSRLITAGLDGMVLVWSVPEFRQLAAFSFDPRAASNAAICGLVLSPDGDALVAFTADGRLRRWSLAR